MLGAERERQARERLACSPRCASAIACSRSCSTSSARSRTASRCPTCSPRSPSGASGLLGGCPSRWCSTIRSTPSARSSPPPRPAASARRPSSPSSPPPRRRPRARPTPTGRWRPRSTSTAPAPARSWRWRPRRLRRRPARHARRLRRAREPRAHRRAHRRGAWRRPSTTRSPGCPTARCSSTASSTRSTSRPRRGTELVRALPRPRPLQGGQRQPRPRRRRRAAARRRRAPARSACAPARHRGALRRRRVRRAARGRRRDGRPRRWSPSASSPRCAGPFDVEGKEVFVGASVGIAPRPDARGRRRAAAQRRPRDVPRQEGAAATALRPTSSRRCTTALLARIELEADLRHALERDEFVLALPARSSSSQTGRDRRRRGARPLAASRRAA